MFYIFFIYFQRIENPFLAAVEQTLGDRYTENVEGIYKVTIKFVIETLIAGYESDSKGLPASNNSNSSSSKPQENNKNS